MTMMLRAASRLVPNLDSSAAASRVCEAPNVKYPSSRVAMKRTDRSQNAHVPSNRMIPPTPSIVESRGVAEPPHTRHTVTHLLHQWKAGDEHALDALIPMVYGELRRLARHYLSSERPDHTLQHTALVHEAYLELVQMEAGWNDRAHFFAVAAQAMRRILVDHARTRNRDKRGGKLARTDLTGALQAAAPEPAFDVLDLDAALERLSSIDARKSKLLSMRYFGGLSQNELSEVLGVSVATINRELAAAREWLRTELTGQ
jgi:RNA polymerase sigma factor (TIGR02999 family)